MGKMDFIECPICRAKLLPKNLGKHTGKVHPEQVNEPIIRVKKGELLWKSRALQYKDFAEVLRYIDACIDYKPDLGFSLGNLVNDANLLLWLIDEMRDSIPNSFIPEPPKLVYLQDLDRIKPEFPSEPSESDLPKNFKKSFQKDHIQQSWNSQYSYLDSVWNNMQAGLQTEYDRINREIEKRHKLEINKYNEKYSELKKANSDYESQITFLERRKTRIQSKSYDGQLIKSVNWIMLPPGESDRIHIKKFCELYFSGRYFNDEDLERFDKISSLNPDSKVLGSGMFEGYMAFVFKKKKIAVLECPQKNNAIYILKGNWAALSQLSKGELIRYHSNETHRIIHQGDWFYRLTIYLLRHGVKIRKKEALH